MRRWPIALLLLICLGAAAFWWLTRPRPLAADAIAGLQGDAEAGALVFAAGGCASCHTAPGAEGSADDATAGTAAAEDSPIVQSGPVLAGGQAFATEFGTFYAPNISSDPEAGIGDWTDIQIVNAVTRGVSPEGQHYYPAFPYAVYGHADLEDIVDLVAYLRTLPAAQTEVPPHDVGFPFSLRRGLGLWKRAFIPTDWVVAGDLSPQAARGRYLAEALAHCGECHTPRNAAGGLVTAEWLGGAENPDGPGRIPNITPGGLDWSEADIAEYLTSGFTPEYDTAGGQMAEVIENLSALPQEDRDALAAYLKAVPPVAPD
ncbi:c-type cytochrome [Mesobaculum littorinae]|uniref:C-type cytochrome n=1 Tax=Mesobaculum littorinae TaxID=2486419 RepID=A0A438AML0_9RHOB|nr:cytochrome c [Mesobaculum littorinae]RVV99855.1 c-type cytochrome [Mesobaculum littorinae]